MFFEKNYSTMQKWTPKFADSKKTPNWEGLSFLKENLFVHRISTIVF